MVQSMKGSIRMVKNKGMGNLCGAMELFILAGLKIIILKDKEGMNGLMVEFMMGLGLIIKWKEKAHFHGLMGENI